MKCINSLDFPQNPRETSSKPSHKPSHNFHILNYKKWRFPSKLLYWPFATSSPPPHTIPPFKTIKTTPLYSPLNISWSGGKLKQFRTFPSASFLHSVYLYILSFCILSSFCISIHSFILNPFFILYIYTCFPSASFLHSVDQYILSFCILSSF